MALSWIDHLVEIESEAVGPLHNSRQYLWFIKMAYEDKIDIYEAENLV